MVPAYPVIRRSPPAADEVTDQSSFATPRASGCRGGVAPSQPRMLPLAFARAGVCVASWPPHRTAHKAIISSS